MFCSTPSCALTKQLSLTSMRSSMEDSTQYLHWQGDGCKATGQQGRCLGTNQNKTEQLQCSRCTANAGCPECHTKQRKTAHLKM